MGWRESRCCWNKFLSDEILIKFRPSTLIELEIHAQFSHDNDERDAFDMSTLPCLHFLVFFLRAQPTKHNLSSYLSRCLRLPGGLGVITICVPL